MIATTIMPLQAIVGGSCGRNALSAGIAEFSNENLGNLDPVSRGIAVTVIGGTTSVIGGGKFENGAITAAFGYLYKRRERQGQVYTF